VARELKGQLGGRGRRFALVVSRTNEAITSRLKAAAIDCLERHEVEPEAIDVYWVPGAFEIPIAARHAAASRRYAAVIALGAVIRGGTAHYEQVVGEAARGVARAGQETGVPVIYGVVSAENLEQAIERAGGKSGNRGFDAALSALEMADLVARAFGGAAAPAAAERAANGRPAGGGGRRRAGGAPRRAPAGRRNAGSRGGGA
jgi:6,7-dimethyl-8-ribityllumazine synthase